MNRRGFIRNILLVASGMGVIPNVFSKPIDSYEHELDKRVYVDDEEAPYTKVIGVGEYGKDFISVIQKSKSFKVDNYVLSIAGTKSEKEKERQILNFVINKILKSDAVNVIIVASNSDLEAMYQASILTSLFKKHTFLTSISIIDASSHQSLKNDALSGAYENLKKKSDVTIPVSNADINLEGYRLPEWMDINAQVGSSKSRIFALVKSLVNLSNNQSFIGIDPSDISAVLTPANDVTRMIFSGDLSENISDEISHTIWSGNINNISDFFDIKQIRHEISGSERPITRALVEVNGKNGVTLKKFQEIAMLFDHHLGGLEIMVCGMTDNQLIDPDHVTIILFAG